MAKVSLAMLMEKLTSNDTQFEKISSKIEKISSEIEKVSSEIQGVDTRLTAKLSAHDNQFEKLSSEIQGVDTRLDDMQKDIKIISAQTGHITERVAMLENAKRMSS